MKNTGSNAYAQAGVNLASGNSFSSYAGKICRRSWGNSPHVRVIDWSEGHFRGPRGFELTAALPSGCTLTSASDGIGSKTIVISATGGFGDASQDLLAMTAGDITRYGGLPLVFNNTLEVHSLGKPEDHKYGCFIQMMDGLSRIASSQRYILLAGETAEMGVCVSSELPVADYPAFNWSGTMVGVIHPSKLITGATMLSDYLIVAFRDSLRSNGGSLVRRCARKLYGDQWWENREAQSFIAQAAQPSVLYDQFLVEMNGWNDPMFQAKVPIAGIAHISGGGIASKFAEDLLFPSGLSAVLDDLWDPAPFMKVCVELEGMSDKEAYSVFNGGQGVLAVVNPDDAERLCTFAAVFGIEARVAGRIIPADGHPEVEIVSKFSGNTFSISL